MSSLSLPIVILLNNICQNITLYIGQTILIAGIIGNMINLIIFISLKTFRHNSCAFYLIFMSFVNLGQLFTGYLSRILITGYEIDWTQTSLFYCKTRWFFFQIFTLTSYSCISFAIIDQYQGTVSYHRSQKWNNIQLAYRFCTIAFILSIIHGIPSIFYFTHINTSILNKYLCIINNDIFYKYRTYGFNIILAGILPILTTVIFGLLVYRNVQNISYRTIPLVRRQLDQQLTNMILTQIIYILIAILPYTIVIILITNINLSNQPILTVSFQFAECFGAMIYYSYFSAPFYIYICVSKRFRQQLLHVLRRLFGNSCFKLKLINNQVKQEI